MKIRDLQQPVNEIDRRGFLKGIGAAAAAGATGSALGKEKSKLDIERDKNMAIARSQPASAGQPPAQSVRGAQQEQSIKNINAIRLRDSEYTVRSLLGKPFKESTSIYDLNPPVEMKTWIYKGDSWFGTDAISIVFKDGKVSSIYK